ncbi:hypothetical protein FACS189449_13310 [Alphaproteobacteria bacterium]|nr:hypothetical protein FACS189449_13310 [Alphaproteobacteria bacterium]
MDQINIVFCVSANYMKFASVTAVSILKNTTSRIKFLILHEDDDVNARVRLRDFIISFPHAEVEFINCSDQIDPFLSLNNGWHKNRAHFLKWSIGENLPNIDKAIYMDVDVIVRLDIARLWNVSLDGMALAAGGGENSKTGEGQLVKCFNSGVLVMDCKKWRDEHIMQQLIKISTENTDKIKYADQQPLQWVFKDKFVLLGLEFNSEPAIATLIGVEEKWNDADRGIIHYCNMDGKKPWIDPSIFKAEVWWQYCRMTPFYENFLNQMTLRRLVAVMMSIFKLPHGFFLDVE